MGFLMRKSMKFAVPGAIGAATAYFLDPDRGRSRRARAKDQAEAALRRRRREAEREANYARGVEEGAAARARGQGVPSPVDEVAVVQVVKQALSALPAATENVTVEVVDGLATLRGQVLSLDDRSSIEAEVRRAPGVLDVQSFLHLPGEPAPNKASAIRAS